MRDLLRGAGTKLATYNRDPEALYLPGLVAVLTSAGKNSGWEKAKHGRVISAGGKIQIHKGRHRSGAARRGKRKRSTKGGSLNKEQERNLVQNGGYRRRIDNRLGEKPI